MNTARVEACPTGIEGRHRRQCDALGYVAFEGLLSCEEVEEARQALSRVVRSMMEGLRLGTGHIEEALPNATKNYAGPRVRTAQTVNASCTLRPASIR